MLTGLLFGQDTTIVLENGRTLKGIIVSETDSTYRIMGESWRITDGVYEVFNTFINISKNETVEEKELSKQDVLLHKSGKNYKGIFLGKVDEKIIFKLEGEESNSAFSINDVDIVITSRGGIKVELYYPFDIETIIEEDKSGFGKYKFYTSTSGGPHFYYNLCDCRYVEMGNTDYPTHDLALKYDGSVKTFSYKPWGSTGLLNPTVYMKMF